MTLLFLLFSFTLSYEFWQITDIHYDENYKAGSDPSTVCREGTGNARPIGDYSCDTTDKVLAPLPRFVQLMSREKVLIYGGDILPRKLGEYDMDYLKHGLDQATAFLNKFGNWAIVPMLGNHDAIPENCQSADTTELFTYGAQAYAKWLPDSAKTTFKKGGYYTKQLGNLDEEVYVVVLNTVLYYTFNSYTAQDTDPTGQFEWFEKTMNDYREQNKTVLLAAHICPGVSERYNWSQQMYDQYDDRIIDLIAEYSDITIGMICGHLHLDTYRVMQNKNKDKTVIGYLSPSLDTYLGINPSVRKYQVEGRKIKNWVNYYVDLNQTDVEWKFNYNAAEEYDLEDTSAESMILLAEKMKKDRSVHDTWFEHMRADSHMYQCDDNCWNNNLCAIQKPRNSEIECYKF
ncbi:sphingomyelin phosphodiesterase, putative [Entamoeba invadens IP1]|uniref:sphingomyelin phosphodiesterase, putative n=1 Tax=Entamoeba invadens IP1 TaxID=370355 RepID=UPI0002C3D563|nr:sphingomyelin phosphodiesterase, putative [Entamoeba invadens IP1]ELP90379.1 sphingomyelin phosphodiesterase, putative [Entamoeba invadens IP1]|eukprot:XP_004257150.1 sphingomyelin phosphodiesterase, putative [Entamoeba invadens IP1]